MWDDNNLFGVLQHCVALASVVIVIPLERNVVSLRERTKVVFAALLLFFDVVVHALLVHRSRALPDFAQTEGREL